MSCIHVLHNETAQSQGSLSSSLIVLLATAAGLSVASLYYSQPMLGVLAHDIHVDDSLAGLIPMLTQLGYALGILLLSPLGDRYDRRQIILLKAGLLTLALLMSGFAPGFGWLLVASLIIGLTATMAQDIVPAAATLASEAHRGRTVGMVMMGLLLGILLSRVVSGFVAEHLGWRCMYIAAALGMTFIGVAAWHGLPRFKPTAQLKYRALMHSMLQLWRSHDTLRRAAWCQGLLAVGFSAFWSTVAIMLHGEPFHMGSAAAGTLGLAGAAGAFAAPLAGRLADRRGPELVIRLGAGFSTISFAAMWLAPLLPLPAQLGLIAISTIGFDFGIQAALVAHQTMVYSIDPGARSRLNALLFTGMFFGMASGAGLGSFLLARWGWPAIVGLAVASSASALAVRLLRRKQVS